MSPRTREGGVITLVALVLVASALALAPGTSLESAAMPPQPGASGINGTCQDCHTGPDHVSTGSSLSIEGVPEMFEPGHAYTLTVVLVRGPGPQPAWDILHAFQLSAGRGHLDATGRADLVSIAANEVASAGAVEATRWSVVWTAPEDDDDVDFFAEAVIGDGDGTAEGDVTMEADGHSYGPLSVGPEDEVGPWAGMWVVIVLGGSVVLFAGYALAFTHRRPPPVQDED